MALLPKYIATPTLSSSRSLRWSGNARTKPVSTEQLRNSLTIACSRVVSMLQHTERTNPRKTPPSTLWPTSVSRSWPSSFWRDERSEGRSVSNQLLSVLCQHNRHGLEEGAYLRDKMSDPTCKPPLRFRLYSYKVEKREGRYGTWTATKTPA